jgi:hypothetical protein
MRAQGRAAAEAPQSQYVSMRWAGAAAVAAAGSWLAAGQPLHVCSRQANGRRRRCCWEGQGQQLRAWAWAAVLAIAESISQGSQVHLAHRVLLSLQDA